MGNISIKINLTQLISAFIEDQNKNKCIVLPIDANHMFLSDKNNVYLDLQAFEIKNKVTDSKDTHLVKQSLPKDIYDKMSDEEKRALPILGNAILWDSLSAGGEPESKAVTVTKDQLKF